MFYTESQGFFYLKRGLRGQMLIFDHCIYILTMLSSLLCGFSLAVASGTALVRRLLAAVASAIAERGL